YASSAATYGDGGAGFDDAGGIDAFKRLQPMNLDGWSKHAFDLWALRRAAAGSAPPLWAGLKFFNVFGPNEYHKDDMMSLVAKNYRKVASGETIRLFKSHRPDYRDGEQRRDFVYAKDCVAAMLWLWRQGRDSGIYNIGSGEARSFLDLMNALGAACGRAPNIEFVDIPPEIRPNYQYFTEATLTRLRQAGYRASLAGSSEPPMTRSPSEMIPTRRLSRLSTGRRRTCHEPILRAISSESSSSKQ